jgi:acetone carboxylase gamma subunit
MESFPPKEVLRDLIEGKFDWVRVKQIMSSPKDSVSVPKIQNSADDSTLFRPFGVYDRDDGIFESRESLKVPKCRESWLCC